MYKGLFLKYIIFSITLLCCVSLKAQSINVNTTSYTPDQLVKDIFVGGNQTCITVDNIRVSGKDFNDGDKSWGYFNKANSNFPLNDGIILSTGRARNAVGPNSFTQNEGDKMWLSDPDLFETLANYGLPTDHLLNATVLEFDFTSYNNTNVAFEYMFLSEEYQSDNCKYSDAFAFLIKKADNTDRYTNIALVPGTNTPVTSLSINDANKCKSNTQYFGSFNDKNYPTNNFNGETKVLKAIANVALGVKYHIKLVISDHGDTNGIYDSAVFLKGRSFGNKDLGPDLTMQNSTALCPGSTKLIDATEANATKYTWYKNGVQILSGNYPTLIVDYNNPGQYEVEIELAGTCSIRGQILIEHQVQPTVKSSNIAVCDDDFDNTYTANLDDYTNSIVDPNPYFQIKYFASKPTNINAPTETPIKNISFNTLSQEVWMWIKPGNCTPVLEEITFVQGQKSSANALQDIDVCDDKISNNLEVDLLDYQNIIANNLAQEPLFYKTESDAKSLSNSIPNSTIILSPTSQMNYFVRFQQLGLCDNIVEIKFNLKQPKASTTLPKEVTVCKNATYPELDAGTGKDPITGLGAFTSYEWSFNNATTQSIQNLPAGQYTVKLGYNGCYYTQTVEVKEAPTAIIDAIDISGSTVTVTAIGGTAPYQYALDSDDPAAFQSSHVFKNVTLGNHTIYVKSNDNCDAVSRDFSLINIPNVISPNADGINDVINLSELLNKTDSRLKIYDRLGKLVFEGNTGNSFIWDGKLNGRVLSTGSYWYVAEWIEPTSGKMQQIKSWILLKNY